MSTLNKQSRAALRDQLMAAMLPDSTKELAALERAAFKAVVVSHYGPAGLRRIATLPPHWLHKRNSVLVKPSGQPYWERCHGEPIMLPGEFSEVHKVDERAQAAIDTWFEARRTAQNSRNAMILRLDQLLARCRTLAALLDRLPEARDLLKLPPAETDDDIAESVRATLRGRGAA